MGSNGVTRAVVGKPQATHTRMCMQKSGSEQVLPAWLWGKRTEKEMTGWGGRAGGGKEAQSAEGASLSPHVPLLPIHTGMPATLPCAPENKAELRAREHISPPAQTVPEGNATPRACGS